MDWCMMKKVKGYLVWVLVFYTVLVTYFLVLSAWSDDLSVKKRQGDDKLINVLYQEERRHLRSFKDVVKSYGGMVGQKIREQFNGDSTGNSGGDTSENGRTGRRFKSTDVFMSEDGAYPKNANNNSSSNSNNSTGMLEQLENSSNDAGVDRPKFTVEVESWEEAIMGKAYSQQKNNNNNVNNNNSNGNSSNGDTKNDNSNNNNNNNPYNGNIFIEDTVPNTKMNKPGDNSLLNKTKLNNISNAYNNNYNNKKKPVGLNGKLFKSAGAVNKGSNIYNDGTVTDFCDKIDAEEPHLCLSERVTLFHPNHVNITPSHMSFKPIGDLHIYSGFLDTRKKPASIRFMVIAPKGRDSVKGSGYWCAFNLPSVLSQRFYWNGAKEPISVKPDQATQLDYYAASVGHGKELQFYIMSCKVPQRHLPNLSQMDTNRIHLVAGSKKSPLLETVQERISVDVMNNQGLPWHEMIKRSSVLGEVFQMNNNNNNNSNNSKNNIKLDANAHQNNVLSNNNNDNNHDKNNNNNANNNNDRLNNNVSLNSSSSGKLNIPNNNIPPSPPAMLNRNSIVSCIAPISTTTLTVVQMVEFIELTLLLGSQHIVMYTIRVSDDLKDVLAMYRYKGLITVLPWSIPNPSSIWANGRDIALNDCLYRTMHRYEFALFHDMDEFFVPRNTPDLPSFINFLYLKAGMKRNRTSDIIFSSAYYSPPTKIQSQSLTTMAGYTKDVAKFSSLRSIHRTYFNQEHSLRMIRPVMAFRVGGGERKRTVFTISSRYAAVNHYSKCVGTNVPAKKDAKPVGVDCTATKADTHMWRMKDKLIKQAKENIRDLNSKRKVYR